MQKLLHACRIRFYMIGIRSKPGMLSRPGKGAEGADAARWKVATADGEAKLATASIAGVMP